MAEPEPIRHSADGEEDGTFESNGQSRRAGAGQARQEKRRQAQKEAARSRESDTESDARKEKPGSRAESGRPKETQEGRLEVIYADKESNVKIFQTPDGRLHVIGIRDLKPDTIANLLKK